MIFAHKVQFTDLFFMRELIPASPQYYFHFPDSHVFNFVECNLEYSHQSPGEMERIETGSGAHSCALGQDTPAGADTRLCK